MDAMSDVFVLAEVLVLSMLYQWRRYQCLTARHLEPVMNAAS